MDDDDSNVSSVSADMRHVFTQCLGLIQDKEREREREKKQRNGNSQIGFYVQGSLKTHLARKKEAR